MHYRITSFSFDPDREDDVMAVALDISYGSGGVQKVSEYLNAVLE